MDSSERKKYLDIYNNCLKEKYYDPSIGILHDILYRIISSFEKELQDRSNIKKYLGDYMMDKIRSEYIKDIIELFKRIVHDNREHEVLCAYNLINSLITTNSRNLLLYLESFFYPKVGYYNNNYYHNELINAIIEDYVFKEKRKCIDKKYYEFLNPDFRKILDLYKEYNDGIIIKDINQLSRLRKFHRYMVVVITFYHKDKYDINIFPQVLDYVYFNSDYLDEFLDLNQSINYLIPLENVVMNKIMDSCIKKVPIIE